MSTSIVEGNNWRKLTVPSVIRGKTAYPKKPAELQRLGVRLDYDGEITRGGIVYHKFQLQPNAGDDVPSAVKRWKNKNGGTHAVMAVVYVKKDGTKDDVEEALKEAANTVEGV